jgi:hypothetical protein
VIGTVFKNEQLPFPLAQFSLDEATPVPYAAPRTDDKLHGQHFYQSPLLHQGNHTLVITHINPDPTQMFSLDYITYTPTKQQNTLPKMPDKGMMMGATRGSVSVAAAVGVSVAGTVVLAILLLVAFLCYSRRRRHGSCQWQPALLAVSSRSHAFAAWLNDMPCLRVRNNPDLDWARRDITDEGMFTRLIYQSI